jgi:hypothetical protein
MRCRVKHLHVLLYVTGIGLGLVPMFTPASEVGFDSNTSWFTTWDTHGWTPSENDQRAY